MIRMEIALFMVLAFVAYVYFTTGRMTTPLHRIYSMLLAAMLFHLTFDAITVRTVNLLDTVPRPLNDLVHRAFIGTMVIVFYLFYEYISRLVQEETGKPRKLDKVAKVFFLATIVCVLVIPVHYAITPKGNYSDGPHAMVSYVSVAFYLILCIGNLIVNWKGIGRRKRSTIAIALGVELATCLLQAFNPTWLISGMGLTLMTLSFYLTLENSEILRAELVEQKMSMLYLKSQVNPHFLYNTIDTIRIQAQLNGDKKVADLLMCLVDFFRLSVKVDRPLVDVDDEMEMVEAYMELMCYRYPELDFECDIDPELGAVKVPNFILQPIVENSLLHGLKNRGYRGNVRVLAHKVNDHSFEIQVYDNGSGFSEEKREQISEMLQKYAKQPPKLEGNSIGLLNVQKRIKLLCGAEYGLSYTENPEGGVTAHMLLPLGLEE